MGTANFVVSSNVAVAGAYTVNYTISNGSAVRNQDFTVPAMTGTLNFSGATGQTVNIPIDITDDAIIEGTENLTVTINSVSNPLVNIVDGDAIGTITDNDGGAGVGISVADFTVDESAGTATFDVSLNADVQGGFSVDFTVADGSAIAPSDYTVASNTGTLNFAGTNGEVQTVTVTIIDDTLIEASEDLDITLSGLSTGLINIVDGDATGTITDNDGGAGVGISVADFTVDESAGTATFDVSLNADVQGGFSVDFTIADGSAIAPGDYTVASNTGTLNFTGTNGEVQTVTVTIIDDTLIESAEDLGIALSGLTTGLINIVDGDATGTITDNDDNGPTEGISVADFTVDEGVGITEFVITYTGPTVQNSFTVDFSVTDGTAIDPDDYSVATVGTQVTFPAGTADGDMLLVSINIMDDFIIEPNEDLNITLPNISIPAINILDGNGIGTITDNDGSGPGEGISVADFTVDEGVGTADFVITYTGPTVASSFTVDFSITDGTAINPDDYTVATVGTQVTFPAGTANGDTQVVTVNIVDDLIIESSEDLNITLSNISIPAINMVDGDGIGTITDNDGSGPGEGISVADFTVDESVGTADFVITYTGPTVADSFTVDFSITDGTAIDPDDYTVATVGTQVTFPAGTANGDTQIVTVNIVDDMIIEGAEDLNITLSNISIPVINIVDGDGIGTITDNDGSGPGEGISVADFTVDEGVGITEFVITYTGPTVQNSFTVDFSITDGTAIDPDDYSVATVGTQVTFPAGTADGDMLLVSINILDDFIIEPNEDLNITLPNISIPAINILDGNGIGTITDNDGSGPGEGISVADFTVDEGVGTADFVITYTGPTVANSFTVDFVVTDGTAINPDDYTVATVGTLVTFPAGTANGDTQVVTINIVDDMIIEGMENLDITLSNISIPVINMVDGDGMGTITDNDGSGPGEGISVADFTVDEGVGTADLVITYTGPTVLDAFTVDFVITDGSATSPEDYTATMTGSVIFPAGTMDGDTQVVTVNIVDDMVIENAEDLNITLSNISIPAINMVDGDGIGTITDNDGSGPGEGISVADFTVDEGVGTADFVIIYTGPTVQDAFTVDFLVTDGTAINPDDYTVATMGTSVTFPAGTMDGDIQVVTVNIVDDMVIENAEDLNITLSNISIPLINMVDGDGIGTITDNDGSGPGEGISVADFTVDEGVGTADFVITYTGPTVADSFTVDFAITDGSATSPEDYTATMTGSVTFPVGTANGDTQVVTVNIVDDMVIENAEDLNITLSNISIPVINMLDGDGIGTITDNDGNGPLEGISVSDFTVDESVGTVDFVISYTGNTVQDAFNVNFTVTDGSATSPDDYTSTMTGTVTFPAGTANGDTQVVTISIVDDMLAETTEDLNIALAFDPLPPMGINMLDGNGIGTITDNDIMPSPYQEEVTIMCGEELPPAPELTFMGGCGNYTVVYNEVRQDASDSDDYMIIRTWDVTDACGNNAIFEQIVFVMQPQLEEVAIDICIEDAPIDLVDYLPAGFDTNGTFTAITEGAVLNGSVFDPMVHQLQEYLVEYSSTAGDCKYFVDFTITVNNDCVPCNVDDFTISKAITANGDNINDLFEIRGAEFCDSTFDVMVFNRWGNKVFEATDYQNDWGGYAPNNAIGQSGFLPTGTYYYIINVKGENTEQINGYIYIGTQ
ncbi:Calx-beta domain-containing protein [Maribacter sp. 4G9]|uniref:Calx-beta domain-containing protein n=1 Tax=Maribacter sp. 4G9 TaxID=1889777 RepID=UPI000C147D57|nr:hypothetical protein BFP75_02935 [Maribacter sp. 4G9]